MAVEVIVVGLMSGAGTSITPLPSVSSTRSMFGEAVGPQFTITLIVSPAFAVNLYQSSRSPGSCTMPVVVLFPLTTVASGRMLFGSGSITQGLLFPRR